MRARRDDRRRRQHRDLDRHHREVVVCQWGHARVVERGGQRVFGDVSAQGLVGLECTDAPQELSVALERHEARERCGEPRVGRGERSRVGQSAYAVVEGDGDRADRDVADGGHAAAPATANAP
jgi:hypothetical protein